MSNQETVNLIREYFEYKNLRNTLKCFDSESEAVGVMNSMGYETVNLSNPSEESRLASLVRSNGKESSAITKMTKGLHSLQNQHDILKDTTKKFYAIAMTAAQKQGDQQYAEQLKKQLTEAYDSLYRAPPPEEEDENFDLLDANSITSIKAIIKKNAIEGLAWLRASQLEVPPLQRHTAIGNMVNGDVLGQNVDAWLKSRDDALKKYTVSVCSAIASTEAGSDYLTRSPDFIPGMLELCSSGDLNSVIVRFALIILQKITLQNEPASEVVLEASGLELALKVMTQSQKPVAVTYATSLLCNLTHTPAIVTRITESDPGALIKNLLDQLTSNNLPRSALPFLAAALQNLASAEALQAALDEVEFTESINTFIESLGEQADLELIRNILKKAADREASGDVVCEGDLLFESFPDEISSN